MNRARAGVRAFSASARASLLREISVAQRVLGRGASEVGVHNARKAIKRARATLRLLRPTLGAERFAREDHSLRRAARWLGGVRDADVLIETLEGLRAGRSRRAGGSLENALRARLRSERLRARRKVERKLTSAQRTLRAIETRVRAWPARIDATNDLAGGAARLYAKARKAYKAARSAECSDEALHACRKQAKYVWHAFELLSEVHPARLDALAKRAHEVADQLGEDHDLALLRAELNGLRDGDSADRAELVRQIERRRDRLQERALAHAAELYAKKPKRFARDLLDEFTDWELVA
jgi:CHAD domain-containing protein